MSQISARHGTEARYQRGCRCEPCRDANAIASRAKRERRKLAAAGMLDPPPAHLRSRVSPASDRPEQPAPAESSRQDARRRANASRAGTGVPRLARKALRPAQPRTARAASGVISGQVVSGAPPAASAGMLARLLDSRQAARDRPARATPQRTAPVMARVPQPAWVSPERLAIGDVAAGLAVACDVRGCCEPGTRLLDAYPPVTSEILAEQGAEGRGSLPTRRCDRHAAELVTRWPAGTWHEYGAARPARPPQDPPPAAPNPAVETCRLPWNPAGAPAGATNRARVLHDLAESNANSYANVERDPHVNTLD